jgi:hypothetical protein
MLSREIGHSLVPAPPHMITGIIGIEVHPWRITYSKRPLFRNHLLVIVGVDPLPSASQYGRIGAGRRGQFIAEVSRLH